MREARHAAGEARDTGAKVRTEEHTKFWNHEETAKPLASFRIGNYFFATHYKAARKLLVKGQKISADMLDVDSFLADYEEQYAAVSALNQSGFWTAEPYTGIPWMEAFWGCEIIAGEESFMARPLVTEARDLEKLQFNMDNPWVAKYFEFVTKLNTLSQGRFPVGAPIMRGQGDTAGALMGQTEFIYALYEEPEIIKKTLGKIVDSFLRIYTEMHRLNAPFLGGSSMGLYHVWAPGKSLWFQDDIGALFSPTLYREFLLENERRFCAGYRYTMMHLHPSSFHLLDDILSNQYLKAVEINKDVSGPSITQMLPQFRKVLEQDKCLIIWGDLTEEDIRVVFDQLPPRGIFFNILLPDFDQAGKLNAFLDSLVRHPVITEKIKHKPVYRQIYSALVSELDKGLYDESGMLPSEKELCGRFGVERNTIRKSLQLLVDDNRVIRRPGRGTELVKPKKEADMDAAGAPVLLITQVDYLNTGKGESFHYKLINTLGKRLWESGCNMLFKPVYKPEDFSELLYGVSPKGIIFESYNRNDYYLKMIQSGLPTLSLNQYTPLMTSIVSGNFDGAYDVVRRLFRAGHRRIAFILGKPSYNSCKERLSGIRRFYTEHDMELGAGYLLNGDWLFSSGVEAASHILGMEKEKRPTAVFAFNDDMAYGCYSELVRSGLSLPADMSIVGFDNSDRYADVFPQISTVDVNLSALVHYAVWYLTETFAGRAPKTAARIEIPTTFCARGTIA